MMTIEALYSQYGGALEGLTQEQRSAALDVMVSLNIPEGQIFNESELQEIWEEAAVEISLLGDWASEFACMIWGLESSQIEQVWDLVEALWEPAKSEHYSPGMDCRAHIILSHPSEPNQLILTRGEGEPYQRSTTGHLKVEGRSRPPRG